MLKQINNERQIIFIILQHLQLYNKLIYENDDDLTSKNNKWKQGNK